MSLYGVMRMNKEQFIAGLRARLSYLPASETEKSISFYSECIDDRIEDGMSEEEAVAAMGDIDSVARSIETELPLSTIVKQRIKNDRETPGGSALWIVLAIVGFPVWLPLLIAFGAVVLAVYVSIWAVIISLYAVLAALVLAGICVLIYAMARLASLGVFAGLMLLGAAAVCIGLALALLPPMCYLAKQLVKVTALFGRWMKGLLLGKGGRDR